MKRLCEQCGYDISFTPSDRSGRRCPECGMLGRGLRPWQGFWRGVRQAVAVGSVLWGLVLVVGVAGATVGVEGSLRQELRLQGSHAVVVYDWAYRVLVAAALLASVVCPFGVSDRLGRSHILHRVRWRARLVATSLGVLAVVGVSVLAMVRLAAALLT